MPEPAHSYTVPGLHLVSAFPMQLTPGERRLIFALEKIFTPDVIIADCYFPKPDQLSRLQSGKSQLLTISSLAQIDCLALNASGIFVFESKDYSGYIYGHGERQNWTQVLNFGREKHQFYNPVRQNQAHIDAIRGIVPPDIPIYSIIVFSRGATLKVITDLPANCSVCTQADLRATLQKLSAKNRLSKNEVRDLIQLLNASRINPDAVTRNLHVDEVTRAERSQNRQNP